MDPILTVEHIRRRMAQSRRAILAAKRKVVQAGEKLDDAMTEHAALCELLCGALNEHGPANDVPGDVITAVVAPKEDD